MSRLQDWSGRVLGDLREGRHWEAYALFFIGAALTILGLVGIVGEPVLLSAILLATSFLVLHSAVASSDRKPALDRVLRDRQDYGSFSKLLPAAKDLRIYGPTAVNILNNSADIRRFVLSRGGVVRVIVQADDPGALAQAAIQLDDNLDLKTTLDSSMAILAKLAALPGFSYRTLSLNPGFSLLIVNATSSDGYVIFESHGFQDDNIADRMHIVIRRQDSSHWFNYWVARFDAMWATAGAAREDN